MENVEIFNKENVVTAHYCDEAYENIEVVYNIGEETHVYVLQADPNNNDYKALVKAGWDTEEIAAGTERSKREQSQDFNLMIQGQVEHLLEEAKAELKQQLLQIESDIMIGQKHVQKNKLEIIEGKQNLKGIALSVDSLLFDTLLDNNEDKDNLFKFKLWALELEFVKSGTKANKSRVRKAKSVFEGMGIINELHVSNSELLENGVDAT
jgi:hypothetical protein